MKIMVIGSTGRTGKHVLTQGVQSRTRDHCLRPPARNCSPTAPGWQASTRATLTTSRPYAEPYRGQDAVIAAVGGSRIAATLITAMHEHGVRRVVMTSSRSVPATRPRLAVSLAWLFFREAYVDLARAEGMLQVSGLDWSIARATMLNDKPPAGRVHIDFEANATGGAMQLSRADYATALLDTVEDPALIGKALGICGPR
ncbi:NAD(P)-dependent oxidoreductase [Nonomuraea dietziae]|uniref:NAD(P)-dependent oxidoreductase n=1 Tax=Nonomuraea dietziae TaxID=65515 RepID=UPI0031E28159